jgi:hypothetical protein
VLGYVRLHQALSLCQVVIFGQVRSGYVMLIHVISR